MTTLRFPVSVCLEVTPERVLDDGLPELVAGAVAGALGRATDRARGLRIVAAAPDDALADARVSVSLTGDELPGSVTKRLSATLAGVAQAEAVRLLSRPKPSTAASERMLIAADQAGRSEPFHWSRLLVDPQTFDRDAYLVPSYDEKGKLAPVAIKGTAGGTASPPRTHLELRYLPSDDGLVAALAERYGASPPSRLIAVFKGASHRPEAALVSFAGSAAAGIDRLGEWQVYVPSGGEGLAAARAWSFYHADTLHFVQDAPTAADRFAVRKARLLKGLREGAVQLGLTVSEADLDAQAADLARKIPDTGRPTRYYMLLSKGEEVQLIEVARTNLPTDDLPVTVFSVTVEGDEATGRGTGSPWGRRDCPELPLEELLVLHIEPEHAFLAEPPLEDWPPGVSGTLREMVADVASRLDMAPGRFPGMFLLAAVERARRDVLGLGPQEGAGKGADSPRFVAIKRIAGAFEPMARLERFYARVIAGADEGRQLACPLSGNSSGWLLHFYEEYFARRDRAVEAMFKATCQDVLLDILESSHYEIVRRSLNFEPYMKITRVLILLMLVDTSELLDLRGKLDEKTRPGWTDVLVGSVALGGTAAAAVEIGRWYGYSKLFAATLEQPPAADEGPPQSGRIKPTADGPRVQDSTGRWWSRQELDAAIAGGKEQAFAIDPMLEKLASIPDTVARLKAAGAKGIDAEFRSLLDELARENESKQRDVRDDVDIAFGLSSMREKDISSTTDIGAELTGIHKRADDKLKPLFTGEAADTYVSGMRTLASIEIGAEKLEFFLNLVGLTALAILCPPAAFAIGAAEALHGLDVAFEHEEIQRAMLGNEDVLSRAGVEAELWGAAIGAALTFIPEVPGLLRGASKGVGALIKGEASEVAATAGRQLAKAAAEHLAELATQNLAKAFVEQCLIGYVLNLALEGAINRLIAQVQHEVEVTGDASVADLPGLVSSAIHAAIGGPPKSLGAGAPAGAAQ